MAAITGAMSQHHLKPSIMPGAGPACDPCPWPLPSALMSIPHANLTNSQVSGGGTLLVGFLRPQCQIWEIS